MLTKKDILKQLQNNVKYQGKTQKTIFKELGGLYQCRKELVKLRQFHYYEQLPYELQNMILLYSKALKYYPRLCKRYNTVTDIAYFNEYCDVPMSINEIKNGLMNPDKIIFYRPDIIQILNRYHNQYYWVELSISNEYLTKFSKEMVTINSLTSNLYSIDFKNKLAIYQKRRCETIKPGYAKSKILTEINWPDHFYNIQSLLYWFMILRLNCKQFNLPVPKNKYSVHIRYHLTNVNDIMVNMIKDCHDMQARLIEIITNN